MSTPSCTFLRLLKGLNHQTKWLRYKTSEKYQIISIYCRGELNCERQFKIVDYKSFKGLESLEKLKSILPKYYLSNLHQALLESLMRYADVIWGILSNSKIESLQYLQERVISMIDASRIKAQLGQLRQLGKLGTKFKLNNFSYLIVPLCYIRSLTGSIKNICGTNTKKHLTTPDTI